MDSWINWKEAFESIVNIGSTEDNIGNTEDNIGNTEDNIGNTEVLVIGGIAKDDRSKGKLVPSRSAAWE